MTTKTPAYLISLSGMGEHMNILVDQTAWDYLQACIDWEDDQPHPVLPEEVIHDAMSKYAEEEEEDKKSREEVIECLTFVPGGSSPDNDLALAMIPSAFNGARFSSYSNDIKALVEFCVTHKLDMKDIYEGYIY